MGDGSARQKRARQKLSLLRLFVALRCSRLLINTPLTSSYCLNQVRQEERSRRNHRAGRCQTHTNSQFLIKPHVAALMLWQACFPLCKHCLNTTHQYEGTRDDRIGDMLHYTLMSILNSLRRLLIFRDYAHHIKRGWKCKLIVGEANEILEQIASLNLLDHVSLDDLRNKIVSKKVSVQNVRKVWSGAIAEQIRALVAKANLRSKSR